MKKNLLTLLFCLGAMTALNVKSNGQTLVHYWNFNNFTTSVTLPAIASLAADYSIIDTSKARLVYQPIPGTSSAYSDYCDFVTGDTTNARQGAPAGNGFRARNPNDSMELLFYIPSTLYHNLVFKYATQTSSYTSGDSVQLFSYSLDSGSTWITSGTGLSEWLDSAQLVFGLKTVSINDPLAQNNRKLVFRIQTLGRNHTTGGNNRFDNVTLEGDMLASSVTETEYSKFNLYPNPVVNQLEITSNSNDEVLVIIVNTLGQTAFTRTEKGDHISINTANFSKGLYYISIRDVNGNVNTQKFIKL